MDRVPIEVWCPTFGSISVLHLTGLIRQYHDFKGFYVQRAGVAERKGFSIT